MPALEQMSRNDDVVLWIKVGQDKQNEPIVGTPIPLKVQLTETQSWYIDPQGNTSQVDAKMAVDRDFPIGSVVWSGKLANFVATDRNQTFYAIKGYSRQKDLKGRIQNTRRVAMLMRFQGSLPTVVG